jgi:hypothetical protein
MNVIHGISSCVRSVTHFCRPIVIPIATIASFAFALPCVGSDLLTRVELAKILDQQSFEQLNNIKQISAKEWSAAGVTEKGRSLEHTIVNPGENYNSTDYGPRSEPDKQLVLAAKNRQYLVVSFWAATHGGPMLRLIVIEGGAKPSLVFSAIMDNDIPRKNWDWKQIKRHVHEDRLVILRSFEHPGPGASRN